MTWNTPPLDDDTLREFIEAKDNFVRAHLHAWKDIGFLVEEPIFTYVDETHHFRYGPAQKTDHTVHVHAERVGPLAIADGALRPDRVLYTWPMICKRARGTFEQQLFEAHGPWMGGAKTRPRCEFCACHWPCPNAEEILDHFGLTKVDFDFRPEDNVSDESRSV